MRTSEAWSLSELARLVDGALIGEDIEVEGVQDDSRRVRPGDLFFCVPGARFDGTRFASDAVERGARALVLPGDHGTGSLPDVPKIHVTDVRVALARVLELVFREALASLRIVGVTGTNGKTTTVHLMGSVLNAAGIPTCVIGTLGIIRSDGSRTETANTTPGALTLLETLVELAATGERVVVMEVSSQAVVQERVSFLPFQATAFTSFSPEHFELHGDLETYRRAKLRFFEEANERARREGIEGFVNLIHTGDADHSHFEAPCLEGTIRGFSILDEELLDPSPDRTVARPPYSDLTGSRFEVSYGGNWERVRLRLGGRFNVVNALGAVALAEAWGLPFDRVREGLFSVESVPGRFQRVPTDHCEVIVDYAHSSDGLENLLRSCVPLVDPAGELVVVFGCGGDKDHTKRPRMGAIAARFAHRGVLTDDNPRGEPSASITDMILGGMGSAQRSRFEVEHDRREAIRLALSRAGPKDLVVIAGKGHETTQESGGQVKPFNDLDVIREVLDQL